MIQNIGILGCGWLGMPLASFLVGKGHSVKGSTSTASKIPALKKVGIDPYLVSCNEDSVFYSTPSFFNADALIINIPPRRGTGFDYAKSMGVLAKETGNYQVGQVIFISSTSVYPEKGKLVTEADAFPETERGKALLEAEKHFKEATIIRLSGLIGPNRIPGTFRKDKAWKDGPVNLIHLDDCISIIYQLLEKGATNSVYNACCPEHPLRSQLYTHVSSLGFETAKVMEETDPTRKLVSSQKLIDELGYTFKYNSPLGIGKEGY